MPDATGVVHKVFASQASTASRETDAALHGLLMPMRRLQKPEKPEPKSKQTDIEDED